MSSNDGKLLGWCAVGFGAGLYFFYKGFRIFREYRVLADTPETPIRSIAMGLVEVRGKARPAADKLASGPVTGTPCLFYKVDIEKWIKDKNSGHWSHYATDADGLPFYLEDASGKVLVDAHGAEYDLLESGRRETSPSSSGLLGMGSSSRETSLDLVAYVNRVAAKKKFSFGDSLGSVSIGEGLNFGSGTNRYRLTEYCILPEHWYEITGTCAENPTPKDEHDRNLIVKGQNEPTFLISWKNKQAVDQALRKRAALHIFGGAALSVVCLAFLLHKFGWL